MKVLVVGNGNHSNKRIIPALLSINNLSSIYISYRGVNKYFHKIEKLNYIPENMVPENKYDLIIYATQPIFHFENLIKYKNFSEKHLIEKPITSNVNEIFSRKFEKVYKEKQIYEALMYLHHPVYETVRNILETENCIGFNAKFTVPHSNFSHYRYDKEKGGGSLLDQGIYPISLITSLFKEIIIKNQTIKYDKKLKIDLKGKIEFENIKNCSGTAYWELGNSYSNFLKIETEMAKYEFPNIFSKNENIDYKFLKTVNKSKEVINIGRHNQFQIMYEDILNNNFRAFEYSNYDNLKKRYRIIKNLLDINI